MLSNGSIKGLSTFGSCGVQGKPEGFRHARTVVAGGAQQEHAAHPVRQVEGCGQRIGAPATADAHNTLRDGNVQHL